MYEGFNRIFSCLEFCLRMKFPSGPGRLYVQFAFLHKGKHLRFIIKYNNGINANETHYKGLIVLQRSLGVVVFLDVIGLFWHSFVHLM